MAVVEEGAVIGAGVEIGPFCHVSSRANLGPGVRLVSHVSIQGATTIGDGTEVGPHTALGGTPQNRAHRGSHTTLTIGRNCIIRECVTMHVGTDSASGTTSVGDNCFIMGCTHIAHDCIVGNGVTLANLATIAGHCEIGDHAIVSGMTAVHQFVRVGHHAFLSGCSAIVGDVIPYGMAVGNRAKLRGLNIVGMKRSGMKRSDIVDMRAAVDILFDERQPIAENAPRVLHTYPGSATIRELVEFVTVRKKRYFTVPPKGGVENGELETHG